MPRKSSKTAHVMNLLAGEANAKETETTANQEEVREEAAKRAPESAQPEAGTEFSEMSADAVDPLAELIKGNLEESMEDAGPPIAEAGQEAPKEQIQAEVKPAESEEQRQAVPEPVVPEEQRQAEAEPAASEARRQAEAEPAANEARRQAEPEPTVTEAQRRAEAEPAAREEQIQTEAKPVQEAVGPKEPAPKVPEPVDEEPSYQYVNVMEKIVNDEVLYFMREFDMCTCDRCVADTKALALTRMPSKYIVREKSAISPLMNFYANKFIGYVTVELTKACTIVKESPHHDR